MFSRRNHYLISNNIIVPEQFGFRKGIFTENAIFKLTDNVSKSLIKKMHIGRIFWIWLKLDCVNNEILLSKLHYLGIQGAMANWSESYLTDRGKKKKGRK
jgi:hypothetical protein